MQVKVLFFGQLKDVVGAAEDRVELPEGASVEDLLAHYRKRFPRWEQFRPSLAVAVNQEYAEGRVALKAGDEVALLPPVSGGAHDPSAASLDSARDRLGTSRIELTRAPIVPEEILAGVKAPADGAVVAFDGIVRKHSGGRQTLYLDYEAYEPMARRKMEEIVAEIHARWLVDRIALVHRLGRLEIGDTSVFIAVSAPHRAAAFEACRHAIERLKRTVPIWKKEYFADGAVWVEGELPGPGVAAAPAATTHRDS